MKDKKISLISTIGTNVGDDFIRYGIMSLLEGSFGSSQFITINKHNPMTMTPFPISLPPFLGRSLESLVPVNKARDVLLTSDLVIHAGTPLVWCSPSAKMHCSLSKWRASLYSKRLCTFLNIPYLILGAGSCQPRHADAFSTEICSECGYYLKALHRRSAVFSVRDSVLSRIMTNASLVHSLLPCPSIFARDYFSIAPRDPSYGVLNFMSNAGPFYTSEWGGRSGWISTIVELHKALSKDRKIVFACHNKKEVASVRRYFPNSDYFYSRNAQDYLSFYAHAEYGIFNRVHGAYALASFGRPSILIGVDSRISMGEQLGLPYLFAPEQTSESIILELRRILRDQGNLYEEIEKKRKSARVSYMDLMQAADFKTQ